MSLRPNTSTTASTRSPGTKPSSLHADRRRRELEQLADGEVVDVLVVGGGVTGVSVALDAVLRGWSVALLERADLAHGTSRWSSKLVHGGLRYLASGQVGIAYESAVERGILMERTAPHLTRPFPMVVPAGVALHPAETALAGVGAGVADLLRVAAGTRRATLGHPRWIAGHEARRLVPGLRTEGLRGAVRYWDGQLIDDARLVVAIARTAAAFGARILTRCEVVELTGDGAVVAVSSGADPLAADTPGADALAADTPGADPRRDGAVGPEHIELRARAVINATGVWADRFDPQVALRPSKGAHLLLRPGSLGNPVGGLTVPVRSVGSRFVFAIPQPDGPVLLGITDDPVDAVSDEPTADAADQTFLLDAINQALQVPLTSEDVIGSFAGLRPLLAGEGERTADLSREHRVIESVDGVLTIVGGKLTTARRMARDVLDRLGRRDGWASASCRTAQQPLVGAQPRARLARLDAPSDLVRRYGGEAVEVAARMARDPDLAAPLFEGSVHRMIDLVWALEHEAALTVDDLLDRRTRVGLVPADRQRALPVAQAVVDAYAGT